MREHEIRPQDLFDRFLELARSDGERFFLDRAQFRPVPCPGCGEDDSAKAFEKNGFPYSTCKNCGSLFQNPRPAPSRFADYLNSGASVSFWTSDFYARTAESRRELVYAPRAEYVGRLVDSGVVKASGTFVDVGSGFGIFLEEVRGLGRFDRVVGVEPAGNMAAACRRRGFEVYEVPAEDLPPSEIQADLATNFEVIEHVHDTCGFLSGIRNALRPGGVLMLTTLTISGLDLQILWDRSKSIYPPHHINLMSTEGIEALMDRVGFEVLQLFTPGKLDVDIIRNALAEDPSIEVPRFVRYLLERREEGGRVLQDFLQSHCLSSHVWVVARRV